MITHINFNINTTTNTVSTTGINDQRNIILDITTYYEFEKFLSNMYIICCSGDYNLYRDVRISIDNDEVPPYTLMDYFIGEPSINVLVVNNLVLYSINQQVNNLFISIINRLIK